MAFDFEQFIATNRRRQRRETIKGYLITCGPPILIGIGLFIHYLTK